MENTKQDRILEIFFRALRGEDLSVQKLANEYRVSTKSISRDINDFKAFLANHRELVGNTELNYSYQDRCYRLYIDEFLSNKELFALVEVLIGSRAFSRMELLTIVDKLKRFTTTEDRPKLNELIRKEIYHYSQVHHDCESVTDFLWQIMNCINQHREISIEYYKMDRSFVTHRIRPVSVMFSDYYFYLIAFKAEDKENKPVYFRVDRIRHVTEHRKKFELERDEGVDEGLLRKRSLLMWPGPLRIIKFEFTGPSVQAVLDKLPTAQIIERKGNKYLIEAETYGDGIKMWLLSQGSWVKVVAPQDFVEEMKAELKEIFNNYNI